MISPVVNHCKCTVANAMCYFISLGIQKILSQNIIDSTRSCSDNDNLNFEDSIIQIKFPITCNGIHDLDQSIDAPMHLICLDITKSVLKLSSEWLSGTLLRAIACAPESSGGVGLMD